MATGEDTHKVVSLRIEAQTLERIDYDAERQGLSRTQYILGWLPETYPAPTETSQPAHQSRGR